MAQDTIFGSYDDQNYLMCANLRAVCDPDLSVKDHELAMKRAREFLWMMDNQATIREVKLMVAEGKFDDMSGKIKKLGLIQNEFGLLLSQALTVHEFVFGK